MNDTSPSPERQTPTEGVPAPAPVPEAQKGSGRFSAYDKTYLKFVGGVHDTKKSATDAAKAAEVEDFEIVEV